MRRFRVQFIGIAAIVGSAAVLAQAKGRRPDYREQTVYQSQPVRYGSAANPNKAFSPPRFDDYPAKTQRSGRSSPSAPAPSAAPAPAQAAPVPKASPLPPPPPAPVSNSEPPLPDYPTEDPTATQGNVLDNAVMPTPAQHSPGDSSSEGSDGLALPETPTH